MSKILIISKIQEVSAKNESIDFFNDKRIKRHTFNIAKGADCPVITSIFGLFNNPLCHIRKDLN
jgi:hypothetical protein